VSATKSASAHGRCGEAKRARRESVGFLDPQFAFALKNSVVSCRNTRKTRLDFPAMRRRFEVQHALGQTPIDEVDIPTKSRDELPPVLAGLQWIFSTPKLSEEIFTLLEKIIPASAQSCGRRGMDLWQILVLGTVRLALDCDYDRLEHIANHDSLVRAILGVCDEFGKQRRHFTAKTIGNNVCYIDEDVLRQINAIVARHGREVFKKRQNEKIAVKIDSYVLESNVHYPTDCNLLWDAIRKCIELIVRLFSVFRLPGWRKARDWKRRVKGAMRECEKVASRGGSNNEEQTRKAAQKYIDLAVEAEARVSEAIEQLKAFNLNVVQLGVLQQIQYFHSMLIKHIDLVERRLIKGETIPHEEKVFSLFEPHTELIKKGKQRPPVEFGHRLLIATDQHELILDYLVMEGSSEPAEVVPLVNRLRHSYGEDVIGSLSTDQGFSSEENRDMLELYIPMVVMPKKGKLNAEEQQRQSERPWRKLSNRHSAVESDINCLEHHGLNRCPDKRLRGFKRYAGLGVLAYNLHKIGAQLLRGGN
jgi:transposase, IS5 family